MNITEKLIERFNAKWALDESGCWLWKAATIRDGYGQIKIPGTRRQIVAHRLSYMIHKGAIQDGNCVLHTCDNPPCVNPDHLFVGTKRDNAEDMARKMRHTFGERNARHKLTTENVLEIFRLLAIGVKQSRIAAQFQVGQMQISRINTGDRWGHLRALVEQK